jgi:hypothetical protein
MEQGTLVRACYTCTIHVHAECNNSIEPEVNSCLARRRHDDDMTKQVDGGAEDPQIQEPFFELVRSRRKPIVILERVVE